ncbi:hypothetical protein ABPG72_006733 [Tetrahymena utriculariae]
MLDPLQESTQSPYQIQNLEYPRLCNSQVQLRKLQRHQSQLQNRPQTQQFRISLQPQQNNYTDQKNKTTIDQEDLTITATTLYDKKQFEAKKSNNIFILKAKKNMFKKKIQACSPSQGLQNKFIQKREDLTFNDLMKLYGVTLSNYQNPKQEIAKVLQPKTFYNSQRGIFKLLSSNARTQTEENSQYSMNLKNNLAMSSQRCNSVQKMIEQVDDLRNKKYNYPKTNREQILCQQPDSNSVSFRKRSQTAIIQSQINQDIKGNSGQHKTDLNVLMTYYKLKEKSLYEALVNNKENTHQVEQVERIQTEQSKNDQQNQSQSDKIRIMYRNKSTNIRDLTTTKSIKENQLQNNQVVSQQLQIHIENVEANQQSSQNNQNQINIKSKKNIQKKKSKSEFKKLDDIPMEDSDKYQLSPRFEKYINQDNQQNKKVTQNNQQQTSSPKSENKMQSMIQDYKDRIDKIHQLQQIKSNNNNNQSSNNHAKKIADVISAQTMNQWTNIMKKRQEQENNFNPLPAFYITKKLFSKPTHIIPVDQCKKNFKNNQASPKQNLQNQGELE